MILENIKRLCARDNITIMALEKATGIGNGVIARWGHVNPRVDLVQKVAEHFGVTVDELLRPGETEGKEVR